MNINNRRKVGEKGSIGSLSHSQFFHYRKRILSSEIILHGIHKIPATCICVHWLMSFAITF